MTAPRSAGHEHGAPPDAGPEENNVFEVWRLDRLGRSLSHLVGMVETLAERGVQFVSLIGAARPRM